MINTFRPRQNGRHFADDIFNCIYLNDNVWFPIKNSLKFVPEGQINKILALVQIMAWRRPGEKPLSEPMMVSLLTHICIIWPQWVSHHQNLFLTHSVRHQLPGVHMMTSSNGNILRVTGPLREEFIGHRWIPLTKASNAELWCFLWSGPDQTVKKTIETLVKWDAIFLIMT